MTLFFSKHSKTLRKCTLRTFKGSEVPGVFFWDPKSVQHESFPTFCCFGDALCCWKSIKSWWWFVLPLFCWWWCVLFCFGLLKPASMQFFWGTVQTFQPCYFCGGEKRCQGSQVSWKKLCCLTFVPRKGVAGEKKTEFWNPTDLIVWFKKTVYIYILPETNSKRPWKFQRLEDDEVSFWVKRPIFRCDLCC